MLAVIVSLVMSLIVVASMLQFFFIVSAQQIIFSRQEQIYSDDLYAQSVLSRAAIMSGNGVCGSDWSKGVWLDGEPQKAIEVIGPNNKKVIHQLGIDKRGSGQWAGSSILWIHTVLPGTTISNLPSSYRVQVKANLHFKPKQKLLFTDCVHDWLGVVDAYHPASHELTMTQKIPSAFQAGDFIEPWYGDIFYIGKLPKSKNQSYLTALYIKHEYGRRGALVDGISSLLLSKLKPRRWLLQINKSYSVLETAG